MNVRKAAIIIKKKKSHKFAIGVLMPDYHINRRFSRVPKQAVNHVTRLACRQMRCELRRGFSLALIAAALPSAGVCYKTWACKKKKWFELWSFAFQFFVCFVWCGVGVVVGCCFFWGGEGMCVYVRAFVRACVRPCVSCEVSDDSQTGKPILNTIT